MSTNIIAAILILIFQPTDVAETARLVAMGSLIEGGFVVLILLVGLAMVAADRRRR
jgi:hypothetical protein